MRGERNWIKKIGCCIANEGRPGSIWPGVIIDAVAAVNRGMVEKEWVVGGW